MSKYLDLDGLEYYTDKIKDEIATKSNFDALSNRPTYNNQQMTHNTNIPVVPTKVSDLTNDSDFANKTFVNSSIATNTANFRGTSQPNLTEEQFLSWANTLTKTNNDYIFWNTTDSNGNTQFKRYKYNGSSWEYEYVLNNSSFTAEQWASINSGATTDKLNSYVKKNTVAIVDNMKSRNILMFENCDSDNCELFFDGVTDAGRIGATSAIENGNYCEISTYSISLMIDFDNMTEPKTFTMSCSSGDVNNRSCSALIYGQTNSGWGWTEVGYAENSNSVTFTINPSDYLYLEMFAFRFNQDKNNTFTDTESVFYNFQFEEGNVATDFIKYFDIKDELQTLNSLVGNIPRATQTYGIGITSKKELYCRNYATSGYNSLSNYGFISKGTLENVLTGKSLVPVSGTNDGTNWSTLTIDGTTKNIPSGGGSSKEQVIFTIPHRITNPTTCNKTISELAALNPNNCDVLIYIGAYAQYANALSSNWSDDPELFYCDIKSLYTDYYGYTSIVSISYEDDAFTSSLTFNDYESKDNRAYEITEDSTDDEYPTAAAVYSMITSEGLLTGNDVINNVTSTTTNKPLSANMGKELQDQIDNLKSRGRFLSLWNATTGLATSTPTENPYTYKTGDYFIVSVVGSTNYKPTGSTYNTSSPSRTVETNAVSVDDVYYYDGTKWDLQINTQKTVSFSNLAGNPTDNTNLASALNSKQDVIDSTHKIPYTYISNTPTIPTNTISSTSITTVTKLTQAQYNALSTKDANTMYIIVG